jgi:hypothetical protein
VYYSTQIDEMPMNGKCLSGSEPWACANGFAVADLLS